jgi:chromosome segregation ATPase
MRFRYLVMLFVLVWLHASASAEAHRNMGEGGGVCYVAELDQAPPEQKAGAEETAVEKDVAAETKGKGDDTGDTAKEVVKESDVPAAEDILPPEGELGPRAKELEETRRWLDRERAALLEIQEEIHREQGKDLGPYARRKLDEKIEKYSKRLAEYEQKGQAYDEDLETFNALREEEKALRNQLRETETQLSKDYESLRVQKLEIDRMANAELSRSDREELADKLRTYNAQVRDYKERKEAFQKALEAYNTRIGYALEGSE